jgi:hypothetical protein
MIFFLRSVRYSNSGPINPSVRLSVRYFSTGIAPRELKFCAHRKKLASVGAANQVFFVVTKSAGTAPTASASGKLAARTVTQIKVLICLNHCISLGVFLYEI